jgi:hypothetical protein
MFLSKPKSRVEQISVDRRDIAPRIPEKGLIPASECVRECVRAVLLGGAQHPLTLRNDQILDFEISDVRVVGVRSDPDDEDDLRLKV